jgi:hypothetical protein
MPFTKSQLALLNSRETFDTKLAATENLQALLHAVRLALKERIRPEALLSPAGTDFTTGQTAKGENYEGYPYVLIDFPKYFSATEKFTYRTMFWFGHHFFFSVILEGDNLPHYKANFATHFDTLAAKKLWLSTGDLWDWRDAALLPLTVEKKSMCLETLSGLGFLKVQAVLPLTSDLTDEIVIQVALDFFETSKLIVGKDILPLSM